MGTLAGDAFRKVKKTAGKVIQTGTDVVVGSVDVGLSKVGAGGVIPDSAYSSTKAANTFTSIQNIMNGVQNSLANLVVPGSGTLMGALQGLNPSQRSPNGSTSNGNTPVSQINTPFVDNNAIVESSNVNSTYILIGVIALIIIAIIIYFLLK